jgi:uncharacterized membrane protein YkvA (DUF1232 family)
MQDLGSTALRLPRYLNLAQALVRDPSIAGPRKAALIGGLAYAISPVDLVPGIIPVIGQLDDLVVLLVGIRTALGGCTPSDAEAHLTRVGLSRTALDDDLAVVRRAVLWLGVQSLELAARALGAGLRLLTRSRTRPRSRV